MQSKIVIEKEMQSSVPYTVNKARHGDGFSLRLRLHYKAARAGGVRESQLWQTIFVT